jgi:hypothetical protein
MLTPDELKELEGIATRLDFLWSRLSNEDRKRVIRLLIRRVIYRNRDDVSGELTIEWEVGSPTIQAFVPSGNIRHLVKTLFDAGQTPEDIATTLNAQSVRPGTTARTRVFDAKAVRRLLWKGLRVRVKTPGQGRSATILALARQGLGQTAIAQELTRRGIQNRSGRPYTPNTVGAVIRRRARRSSRSASVVGDTGHPGSSLAHRDGFT